MTTEIEAEALRAHTLDLALLKCMRTGDGYLFTRGALIQTVQLTVSPKPLESEIQKRIESLDARRLIQPSKSPVGMKFGLRDEGRNYLDQHG